MLLQYLKKGAYNTFTYATSSILTRVVSFFFLPYFLSKLTLEEFGVWDFYQMIFSMGTLVLASCTAMGLTRFYLLYKDDPEKQQQAVGNTLGLTLVGATIFPIVAFLAIRFFYSYPLSFKYLSISILSISFFSLFSLVLSYLRVREYLWSYFFIFCTQNLIALFLTVLAISHGFGIEGFFYANCLSFCLFLPAFAYILFHHWNFSLPLLKKQLQYSLPLLVNIMLFSLFFSADRLIIKYYCGYESLGTYGLLWRFGSIFQFFSIALVSDASPVVFFNAQKEKNGNFLIAKTISYFFMVLTTVCLGVLVSARYAIALFLPIKYYYLIGYLPLFFLPLICLELARLLQLGIGLSTKTPLTPIITSLALGIQMSMLFSLKSLGLWGILIGNTLCFIFYGLLGYATSAKLYCQEIFDRKKLLTIFCFFGLYVATFHFLFILNTHCLVLIPVLVTWPLLLWSSGIIDNHEKNWLYRKVGSIIKNIFEKNSKRSTCKNIKTVLHLKTDNYSHKIVAGGSFTQTLEIVKGFSNNGCKVICASCTMHEELQELNIAYFQSLKVWPLFFFLRWKIGYLRWHFDCLLSTFCFTWQTKNLFKKNPIDAIFQCYSWLNCTGLLLSLITKKPLILQYNGSEVWMDKHSNVKITKMHRLAEYIEHLNLKYADYIIAVSEVMKDELVSQNIDSNKILVNPNGVNPKEFNPYTIKKTQKSSIRSTLNLEDKFVFGFIGTFFYWQGIDTLAQAIPQIIQQHKNVHFILIGDGLMKKDLISTLNHYKITDEHITITGILKQKTALKYLAACDAFLCPTRPSTDDTRYFCSPVKLFEYMSLAKPIIASDLEQLSDVMSPALRPNDLNNTTKITSQVGLLVDPKSLDEFVHTAIYTINLSKVDKEKLGNNARKKVLNRYTWDQHVARILNFVTQEKNTKPFIKHSFTEKNYEI